VRQLYAGARKVTFSPNLARHVQMEPYPLEFLRAVGAPMMELILPDTEISKEHNKALLLHLTEFSQDYRKRAGNGSLVDIGQIKEAFTDVKKKAGALSAAVDNLEPQASDALQGAYTFVNRQTGFQTFVQTSVYVSDLERRADMARGTVEANLTDSFSRTADFYVAQRRDSADVQHWASFKVLEFVDIFTNHTGTVRNSAEIAACLLPYFDCRYGQAAFQYRTQLHNAVVETGADPIALAQSDPSGKSLLATVPRGHTVLEARPQIKGMEFCPFEFSTETGAIVTDNTGVVGSNTAGNRPYDWFKTRIARAYKYYLYPESAHQNRESVFFERPVDKKKPSAMYAFSVWAQGAYRVPARRIETELIHNALAQIYLQGQKPASEIISARIEWRKYLDCLNELHGGRTPMELKTQCALHYLRALQNTVARHVTLAYREGHNLANLNFEDVNEEWLQSNATPMPMEPA